MQPTNTIGYSTGNSYHHATKHSYQSVLIDPNYVDPSTQPSAFKRYPKFYRRFPLDDTNPIHAFIRLTSTITFNKTYKDGPYPLRVNPSAGALFPTELYVQIRGIKGMIDGIYHLEVATDSLTLIYELIDDGLENYLVPDHLIKGCIFLISCVYFRSSWKYKDRGIRYCFLDSGHHLGAIEASALLHNQNLQFLFDFDKPALNIDLGFNNQEWVTAAVISGERKERSVRQLRSQIPFVCGTDYFEGNAWIETAYQATRSPTSPIQHLLIPQFPTLKPERFHQAILNRRSARRFKKQAISSTDFHFIQQAWEQPIATTSLEPLTIHCVIHRVEGLEAGLYRGLTCVRPGHWSEQTGSLCINQAIARDSAVTLFITAAYTNYQTALQEAGIVGQRIYLFSEYLGLSCTGIGAYYDDETQTFLQTNEDVLYAIAIGL